jgi:RNA polymerase sigma-70 factor, ECF subfamily
VGTVEERGRAAWPELKVDAKRFMAWLGKRANEPGLHAEDLWLSFACLSKTKGALEAFRSHALQPALETLPEHDRDDVGQRVLARLLTGARPQLEGYEGRGSLVRWLKLVVVRESRQERAEAKRRAGPVEDDVAQLSAAVLAGPESRLHKAKAQRLLKTALVSALLELQPEERRLLKLHHLDGLPHGEVGAQLKLPRSTVAFRLAKVREQVLAATRRALEAEGVREEELDALFGAAKSGFELSFSALRR